MGAIKVVNQKTFSLDDILDDFKIFNRYHVELIVLAFLAFATNLMYSNNFIFVAEDVPYRCVDHYSNDTFCNTLNSTHICSEWVYDNPESFVAYFQLACQEWKRTLVGTVHSFGYMCGLLLIGPMSDRLGRKTVAVITGILGGVFGILRSFSTWYWFYIAMEFMEAAVGDICSPMYVLLLETVSSKNKLVFYMMCSFGYSFGGVTLAVTASSIPNWRWLLRALYIPAFLFYIYKYLLDESPRWLLTKDRKGEAVAILEKAAGKSKVDLNKDALESLSCEVSAKVSFGELLKGTFTSKELRCRFFVCLLWWLTSTFVNYGLSINSVSLQGNKYVNFALLSMVDIPGNLIITYILIHFKRRLPLMLSFFTGGVLCISQAFISTDLPWLSIALYMAGKLMGSFFFGITYLYTLELFPTYTRNSMHALCSSLGRVGSMIAPQTPLLMVYWQGLPSCVFGVTAVVAGLATFFVPDICDDSLPDTVLQAEALGKSKNTLKGDEVYKEQKDTLGY